MKMMNVKINQKCKKILTAVSSNYIVSNVLMLLLILFYFNLSFFSQIHDEISVY